MDRDWRLRNVASDIKKKKEIEMTLAILREKRKNRNGIAK
jgi:hypothetical protein